MLIRAGSTRPPPGFAVGSAQRRTPVDGATGVLIHLERKEVRRTWHCPACSDGTAERACPRAGRRIRFLALHRETNRLFEDFWRGFDIEPSLGLPEGTSFSPRVDVEETDGEIRVTAELPGVDEKDLEVHVQDDVLTLKGEKHEEREDRGRGWRERSYGSFYRTIQLPGEVDADKVTAAYKKGILTIRLPKTATARERGRRIPVTAA